jgi:nucleoside triphosphate pyrophosphatase
MPIISMNRPLVLATASPARRKLVTDAGIVFTPDAVDIDESPRAGELVTDYVCRLASAKVRAVESSTPNAVIVSVDTAIGLDGEIIGKPRDEKHARDLLRSFSGRTHDVVSAIAVRDDTGAGVISEMTRTVVSFMKLTTEMMDWYIGTGEWRGRAGGYAIQEKGAILVDDVRGCFTNVIGLSMPTLMRILSSLAIR